MKNLNDYTIEELEEAIEIKKQINLLKPHMVDHPAFDKLQKCVERCIQEIEDGKANDNTKQEVFECAVEIFYGKDIWDWVNKKIT